MKIGILTFHRAHNYGAVLQCYALQEALRKLGYDAWVIDYRQPQIEAVYKTFYLKQWIKMVLKLRRRAWSYLRDYPKREKTRRFFEDFVSSYCHLTPPCTEENIPQDFDAYLIGSDQLWNMGCTGRLLDPVYIGLFKRDQETKLFGYAISGKLSAVDMLGIKALQETVARFDVLSMREPVFAKVIGCLTGYEPSVCCDPTLLHNKDFWDKLTNDEYKNRNYVLIYTAQGGGTLLRQKAEELATTLHCEVINIGDKPRSVEEFLSLIKYAKYVITASFHGTVFSVIFERPVYSVKFTAEKSNRYAYLLHIIGADKLCVDIDFTPVPLEIDYKPIKEKLKEYTTHSLDSLAALSSTASKPSSS